MSAAGAGGAPCGGLMGGNSGGLGLHGATSLRSERFAEVGMEG